MERGADVALRYFFMLRWFAMYQALYRKWRSRTFDQVVGQAVTLKPAGADPEDAWEPTAAERKEDGAGSGSVGSGTDAGTRFSPDDLDF